jgi:phage-related protein
VNSIFDIADWEANEDYDINDIVKLNTLYYYATKSHTSTNSFATDALTNWDGIITENGFLKPNFFWKPSYDSNVAVEPKVNTIKFGDQYEQRIPDGISNDLLKVDLIFSKRTQIETRAICHFLFTQKGKNYFLFTPPPPYNKQKRFKCSTWTSQYVFKDNHEIRAVFEEVVN